MAGKPPSRDKTKEQFWRKAIARQLGSGLSQNGFCAAEGLNPNNFSWWKREIAERDKEVQPNEVASETNGLFIPVAQVKAVAANSDGARPIAEIDLAGGLVRIFAGIDRHSLHEIIAALREKEY